MLYRAADDAAELVALQAVSGRLVGFTSVEHVIAYEFERISMERVRAALRHHVYGGSGVIAVLCRKRAGFELELLGSVRERKRQVQVVEWVVVRASIQQESHTIRQPTIHCNANRRVVFVGIQIAVRRGICRARNKNKLGELARLKWKLLNALLVHNCADAIAFRFHHLRAGLHRDLGGDGADSQGDVEDRVAAHLEYDPVLYIAVVNPTLVAVKTVWPNREIGHDVIAV